MYRTHTPEKHQICFPARGFHIPHYTSHTIYKPYSSNNRVRNITTRIHPPRCAVCFFVVFFCCCVFSFMRNTTSSGFSYRFAQSDNSFWRSGACATTCFSRFNTHYETSKSIYYIYIYIHDDRICAPIQHTHNPLQTHNV